MKSIPEKARPARISSVLTAMFYVEIGMLALVATMLLLPRIGNIEPYSITSASMEPTIPTGSLVYVDEGVKGEDIAPNDIVAFHISEMQESTCTHRAVANDKAGQAITTKGDANPSNDPEAIPYRRIVGRALISIPYAGFAASFMTENRLVCFACAAMITALTCSLSYLAKFCHTQKTSRRRENGQTY